jgi:ribosomal protein S18 acetylase RimI-like enzyme
MSRLPEDREAVRRFILDRAAERVREAGLSFDLSGLADGRQTLVGTGLFDSFTFLELLAQLETEFGVEVELLDQPPEVFTTLDGLVAIVAGARTHVQTASPVAVVPPPVADLEYVTLTPQHPQWEQLGVLFGEQYTYFQAHGLKIPLKADGERLWLDSFGGTLGKTNILFGALDREQLVGFLHGSLRLLPAYLQGPLVGVIGHLYVRPNYRGHGIARDLVDRAQQWMASCKVSSVELQVLVENQAGLEFWRKAGFQSELLQMRKTM